MGSVTLLTWRGRLTGSGADEEQLQIQSEVGLQAQADLRALLAGLTQYRSGLTIEERVEFDGKHILCSISSNLFIYNS